MASATWAGGDAQRAHDQRRMIPAGTHSAFYTAWVSKASGNPIFVLTDPHLHCKSVKSLGRKRGVSQPLGRTLESGRGWFLD